MSLRTDPVIVDMTQDLLDAGIAPPERLTDDDADFIVSAAMEYVFRGGDADLLGSEGFEGPAEAVREVYSELAELDV